MGRASRVLLFACVAALAGVAVKLNFLILDEGLCPTDQRNVLTAKGDQTFCYFSEKSVAWLFLLHCTITAKFPRYFRARTLFRELGAAAGAQLHALDIGTDNLTIDVAVFPGTSGDALVHLSGVHGVEGALHRVPYGTPHASNGSH
jgi:hypothetical protein